MILTDKIETNNNPHKEMEKGQIKYLLLFLCERLVKDERCKEIERRGKMENPIFASWKQEGIDEGMSKGIEKIVINMKNLGDDIHTIEQRTGLTPEEIEKL